MVKRLIAKKPLAIPHKFPNSTDRLQQRHEAKSKNTCAKASTTTNYALLFWTSLTPSGRFNLGTVPSKLVLEQNCTDMFTPYDSLCVLYGTKNCLLSQVHLYPGLLRPQILKQRNLILTIIFSSLRQESSKVAGK